MIAGGVETTEHLPTAVVKVGEKRDGVESPCSDSSDRIVATQMDPFRTLTLTCNSSELSSSDQERTGKAAQRGPDGSECSHSGRSEDYFSTPLEPLLREHADRFTMHPIRYQDICLLNFKRNLCSLQGVPNISDPSYRL